MQQHANNTAMKRNTMLPYFLCLIGIVHSGLLLQGQVSKKVLDKPVNIPGSMIRIDSLLSRLTKQTGVEFSFNSTRVKPLGMIAIPSGKLSLLQWLQLLEVK